MEFRVLKYFLAVAREENISAAAEKLHVTQPTLSRQIMDLEREIGKKLFKRGHKGITLTDEGMILRKRAEEIEELVRRTERELKNSDSDISGDVYIGSGETEGMRVIARTAKQIREEGYNICFHIYSGNDAEVIKRIDEGLLDFGVFLEGTNLQKYDSLRLPYIDRWGVLMRRDSPLASKNSIKPDELWELPLIVSQQADRNNELSGWMMRGRERLSIVGTYNLLFNASIMVSEGLGYALCIDGIVKTEHSDELCFKPLMPQRCANLDIVWKKHMPLSKPAEMFLKKLKENII